MPKINYKQILTKILDTRSPKTNLTRREYTKLFAKGKKGAPEEYKKFISSPQFKREKARAEKIIKSGKNIAKYFAISSQFPLSLIRKKPKNKR